MAIEYAIGRSTKSKRTRPALLDNSAYRKFRIMQLRKLELKLLEEEIARDVVIHGL